MAFKQPRVPEFNEKDGVSRYLKTLVLFLKDFCQEAWVANRQSAKNMPEIDYPVTSVNGKTGDVELDASDVGALPSNGTAENAKKLDNRTWAQVLDAVYPVGAIYISASAISPASLFGGTWEQLKDRFLLGAGDSYAAGGTGGEAEHTLTIGEMPYHNHSLPGHVYNWGDGAGNVNIANAVAQPGASSGNRLFTVQGEWSWTNPNGSSLPHNNMPPYLAVYMWVRVS